MSSTQKQKIFEELQKLSDQEARLLLGFLEQSSVTVKQLAALASSYGLSHLRLIKSLISLILKDIVVPKFFLPRNPEILIDKVPFPSVFELFTNHVELSRRERDILEGIIRRLKSKYEAHVESFGFYEEKPTHINIWKLIEKYYLSATKSELDTYIKKIINYTNKTGDKLAWIFLLIWTTYYLATKRNDPTFIENYWPGLLDKLAKLSKLKKVAEKIKGIAYFLSSAESELFLRGIELPSEIKQKIVTLRENNK